jgi:hypothetical protein
MHVFHGLSRIRASLAFFVCGDGNWWSVLLVSSLIFPPPAQAQGKNKDHSNGQADNNREKPVLDVN